MHPSHSHHMMDEDPTGGPTAYPTDYPWTPPTTADWQYLLKKDEYLIIVIALILIAKIAVGIWYCCYYHPRQKQRNLEIRLRREQQQNGQNLPTYPMAPAQNSYSVNNQAVPTAPVIQTSSADTAPLLTAPVAPVISAPSSQQVPVAPVQQPTTQPKTSVMKPGSLVVRCGGCKKVLSLLAEPKENRFVCGACGTRNQLASREDVTVVAEIVDDNKTPTTPMYPTL